MASVIRILLIVSLFCSSLDAQDQKFSAYYENVAIEEILLDIAAHFKIDLVFSSTYFEDLEAQSVEISNLEIEEAFEMVLADTDISFNIDGRKVSLQRSKNIFGYIRDAEDHELLAFANVFNEEIRRGSSTNLAGYFSLRLPYEVETITVTYVGYKRKIVHLHETSRTLEIFLDPIASMEEVTISPVKVDQIKMAEDKERELFMEGLFSRLSTGGEPDINQYLYTQTGVSSGPDGIGGLHVRGGNTDQNLILIDGVQVLQSNHAFGLFSIFNTSLLSNAKFTKSNFNPSYIGGVSSVLDMKLDDGSSKKFGGNLSFSTLASQVNINGPIFKGKTSFLLSGRFSHINPLIENISENRNSDEFTDKFYSYGFFDLNAKLSHQFSKNARLFLTYYQGNDRLESNEAFSFEDQELHITDKIDFRLNYGNRVAAVRLSQNFGERWFSNSIVSYSEYRYRNNSYNEFSTIEFQNDYAAFYEDDLNFESAVRQYTLRHDLEFYLDQNTTIEWGGLFQQSTFIPGSFDDIFSSQIEDSGETVRRTESVFYDSNRYLTSMAGLYFNSNLNFSQKAFLQIGLNYSYLSSQNILTDFWSSYHLVQGRISLRSQWNEQFTTMIALDRREQPMHLLSNSNIGFPNDVWVPSFGDLEPQESYQVNLSARFEVGENLTIKTAVFARYLDNLLRNESEISLPFLEDRSTELWEESTLLGDGISQGLEIDLNYATKKFKWSLAYTLSKYDRFFEDLNNDEAFPFVFDQNHNLSINLNYAFTSKIGFYAQFQYSRGRRQTLYEAFNYSPFQSYNNDFYNQAPDLRVSDINEYQLPDYHRLDAGFDFKFGKEDGHSLTIGVQNIYNRANVYFAYFQKVDEFLVAEGLTEGITEILALPVLPIVRYEYSF